MKSLGFWVVSVAFLTAVPASHAHHMVYPETEEALQSEIRSMPWITEPGTFGLEKSQSSLRLPEGLWMLTGDAAERAIFLNEGTEFPQTEGLVVDNETGMTVYFEYHDAGYVALDDWSDVNPDELLEQMMENTENANAERREHGTAALHLKGWIVEPTLDHSNKSVRWVTTSEVEGEQERIVNAVILKLGRKGYEEITWVGNNTLVPRQRL